MDADAQSGAALHPCMLPMWWSIQDSYTCTHNHRDMSSSLACFALRSVGGGSSCHAEGLLFGFSSFFSISKRGESQYSHSVTKTCCWCVHPANKTQPPLHAISSSRFFNLVVMPFHQPYDGNTWKSRFCLHQYVQVRQCQIGNYCAMSKTSFIPLHHGKKREGESVLSVRGRGLSYLSAMRTQAEGWRCYLRSKYVANGRMGASLFLLLSLTLPFSLLRSPFFFFFCTGWSWGLKRPSLCPCNGIRRLDMF